MIVVLNLLDIIEGKEAQYAEYLRRVQPILDRHGAKIMLYGLTKMIFMGVCPQEYCGLIAYDSLRAFREFSRDGEYTDIMPLRDDATTNYVMTVIQSFGTMDDAAAYIEGNASKP